MQSEASTLVELAQNSSDPTRGGLAITVIRAIASETSARHYASATASLGAGTYCISALSSSNRFGTERTRNEGNVVVTKWWGSR